MRGFNLLVILNIGFKYKCNIFTIKFFIEFLKIFLFVFTHRPKIETKYISISKIDLHECLNCLETFVPRAKKIVTLLFF